MEDIKQRLSIEDVIGEYVALKRTGRSFKGLSPFNTEKTPSFIVSPDKDIWHDFSSNKGGDLFSFIMEMEGLDFRGALDLLARKAGVDLAQYETNSRGSNQKQKDRLYEALELAARFYQVQFKGNRTALEYILKTRQFSKEITLGFRIGYSPNQGSALSDFLTKKGFDKNELKAAGLIAARGNQLNDMFRGRIMVPLMDTTGRVVGFTARILEDNPNAPKYINTPSTLLYDKSRHVFGLSQAKEAIRTSGFSVLVEGNLDVIASHQAKVTNVVATAGTALTEMQLKALNRLANDIRLSFDQDKAGINATERAIPIASKVGVSLKIITLPTGKDPDELIKQDPKKWQAAIESADYALDWLIENYEKQLDLKTAEGKRKFSDILLPIVQQLNDPVEKDHYISVLSENLGVSAESLRQKMTVKQIPKVLKSHLNRNDSAPPSVTELARIKAQNQLLAVALVDKTSRKVLSDLKPVMFDQEPSKTLLEFLQNNYEFDGRKSLPAGLQQIRDYVNIMLLQFDELYSGLPSAEIMREASRLHGLVIKNYVQMKKRELAQALSKADAKTIEKLLEKAKQLDHLLKNI